MQRKIPVNFYNAYFELSAKDREDIATTLGSSIGYLRHIAHGRKTPSLGFADALLKIMNLYGAKLKLEDIPLSEESLYLNELRNKL